MNRSKYEKLLPEKHQWPQRKSRLVEYIKYADPDIIGSQELQASQIRDIIPDIENEYDYYGVCRDHKEESEIEAIFYKKNRFNLIEKKTYWFSETPDIRSENPYGKQNALTTLTLQDKLTGNHILLLNVHFSFSDLSSRFYEASFIKNFIQSIPKEQHMILMGDFNTFPFRMDYPHYPFYDGDTVLRIVEKSNIRDAKKASYFGHLGPLHTSVFTPENGPFTEGPEDNVILDHIYVRGRITVLIHAFDKAKVDGEYPSDHLPVIADVLLHPLDE